MVGTSIRITDPDHAAPALQGAQRDGRGVSLGVEVGTQRAEDTLHARCGGGGGDRLVEIAARGRADRDPQEGAIDLIVDAGAADDTAGPVPVELFELPARIAADEARAAHVPLLEPLDVVGSAVLVEARLLGGGGNRRHQQHQHRADDPGHRSKQRGVFASALAADFVRDRPPYGPGRRSTLDQHRPLALRALAFAHDAEALRHLGIGLEQATEIAAETILVELLVRLDVPQPARIG